MSVQNVMVSADVAARRRSGVMAALVILGVLLALVSLGTGPVRLSPVAVIDALFGGGSGVAEVVGAPQSAAFGAVLVIALGLADVRSYALPVAAIAFAFASVFVLLTIAGRNAGLLILILAGLAISSLAGAATALAMNLSSNPFVALAIAFWLLGSPADRSFRHVMLALPFIAAGAVTLMWPCAVFPAPTLREHRA